MIKFDDLGKIQYVLVEVIPTDSMERKMLAKFMRLTSQERADLIVMGFEMLAREQQQAFDKVAR